MQSTWINDFIRHALLTRTKPLDIVGWCNTLIEVLREAKPDHDLHIFGVNRVPGLPNFFLTSSSESRVKEGPQQITVTKKTADIFLDPDSGGLRILQEELPMTVLYYHGQTEKKYELPFYDAICFDSETHSLILGLVVTDMKVQDFLPMEELTQLLPLVRSHAFPLLETLTLRNQHAKLSEDLDAVLKMLQDNHPGANLEKIFAKDQDSFVEKSTEDRSWQPGFFVHATSELRAPMARILGVGNKLVERTSSDAAIPTDIKAMATEIRDAARFEDELIRNLSSLANLSLGDVKPRKGVFPMQSVVRELYSVAVESAGRFGVQIKLQEYTRNIFIAGDQKTLVLMLEKLIRFTMPKCRDARFFLRTTDNAKYVEKGFAAIEFEDTGKIPGDATLANLLDPSTIHSNTHPRLRFGGGLLYHLLSLYIEKCGGKMEICYGEEGGYTVRVSLPQVSRAEHERIMAGEISN